MNHPPHEGTQGNKSPRIRYQQGFATDLSLWPIPGGHAKARVNCVFISYKGHLERLFVNENFSFYFCIIFVSKIKTQYPAFARLGSAHTSRESATQRKFRATSPDWPTIVEASHLARPESALWG